MQGKKGIVILDFGGQYAHLIGSRVRRFGVFSEIKAAETPASELQNAAGIVLSGGPQSVYDADSPQADTAIFELGIPVLGICYGLHWMTKTLGGEVSEGKVKEYGPAKLKMKNVECKIIDQMPKEITVWMSHGDEACKLPEGFELFGTSDACANAAFADTERNFYAVQFHPEVTHSEYGDVFLKNFVSLCQADAWSMSNYKEQIAKQIQEQVGERKVFMLVSGGVDSTVAFALLNEVLGQDRVQGLLVDTGLMRKNEVSMIREAFTALGVNNLHIEDASTEFLQNLQGVYEPEEKRKMIGNTFLDVQRRVMSEKLKVNSEQFAKEWLLGQGTIYPDTIETGATKHADQIKTHHNRVEAIQNMIDQGLVIEPLQDLYKDEVRQLGEELGLPHGLVWRHPFPGPGLGVRILCAEEECKIDNVKCRMPSKVLPIKSVGVQGDGRTYRHALAVFSDQSFVVTDDIVQLATDVPNREADINRVLLCTSHAEPMDFVFSSGYITKERADLLREADAIVDAEVRSADLYEAIWQFPVVLLPFGTTDGGQSVVLRPIASTDAMTANAVVLQEEVLESITTNLMAISGIDAVFLDLTNKPPGTIEWE